MCGIVGYLGEGQVIPFLLKGLMLLQNRGYDSVGVSVINDGSLNTTKYASSSINNCMNILSNSINRELKTNVGIGHTRWATHGAKTDINAHPHHDNADRIAIVHNGIIENFQEVRNVLVKKGYLFKSSTDTEIIAVLIGSYLESGFSMENAIQMAIDELRGTWALVIIHRDFPN